MNSITMRQAVLADLDVVAGLFDAYRQFYDQVGDLVAAGRGVVRINGLDA
jgi:hypothetical protein